MEINTELLFIIMGEQVAEIRMLRHETMRLQKEITELKPKETGSRPADMPVGGADR